MVTRDSARAYPKLCFTHQKFLDISFFHDSLLPPSSLIPPHFIPMGKSDKKTEKKAAAVAKPAKEDKKAAVKVPSSKDILAKAKKAVSSFFIFIKYISDILLLLSQ